MFSLSLFCFVVCLCGAFSQDTITEAGKLVEQTEETTGVIEWIEDGAMTLLDSLIPNDRAVEGRKKKKKYNKYVLPLVLGFLLIKSILLPIALKGLAVLSGKAVILSLMSLILAAIVGLKKVAQSPASSGYDVVNVPMGKYRRNDDLYRRGGADAIDDVPYEYYRDHR